MQHRPLADRVAELAVEVDQRRLAGGVDVVQVGLHQHGAPGRVQLGRMRAQRPRPLAAEPAGAARTGADRRLHDELDVVGQLRAALRARNAVVGVIGTPASASSLQVDLVGVPLDDVGAG